MKAVKLTMHRDDQVIYRFSIERLRRKLWLAMTPDEIAAAREFFKDAHKFLDHFEKNLNERYPAEASNTTADVDHRIPEVGC